MNERFRQLAEQAQIGLFKDQSFGWSVVAGTDQHLSKFAELIVAECIDTYDHWATHSMDKTAFVVAKTHVKEHFGIEP
jgi:hypothetical protein